MEKYFMTQHHAGLLAHNDFQAQASQLSGKDKEGADGREHQPQESSQKALTMCPVCSAQ